MASLPDGRIVPPPHADERAMLEAWLDFHRDTLALKVAGLDDRQVRLAPVASSSLTLLGLVQHLAEVERCWNQRMFAGVDAPLLFGPGNVTGYALDPARGLTEVLATWRAEVEEGRKLTADAALDDTGRVSRQASMIIASETVTLRWVLMHLIEEYARHNGHADLLREAVDGSRGV